MTESENTPNEPQQVPPIQMLVLVVAGIFRCYISCIITLEKRLHFEETGHDCNRK